jgi:hypothetical protein
LHATDQIHLGTFSKPNKKAVLGNASRCYAPAYMERKSVGCKLLPAAAIGLAKPPAIDYILAEFERRRA